MKRFLSVCLPLLLCLMMAMTSCAIQQVDPSDYPGVTQPPSEFEMQMQSIQDAIDSSEPFAANSTVTLTKSADLKLVSTFQVNKQGNCTYVIQRLKPYTMGASASDLIETIRGTKKASDSPAEGVSVGQLDFSEEYFVEFDIFGIDGVYTMEGSIKDECIADFLGYDLDAANLQVVIEMNDNGYISSITLVYDTDHGAMEVITKYQY